METVHLKINAKVYDHVMWLLKQFSSQDVQIVSDDFIKIKAELDETLRQLDNNEMGYMSLDEFEKRTDEYLGGRNED